MRDLNAIAPLITTFFLIACAMINVVVLIEQSLAEISLADVNILGLPRDPDFDFLRQVVDQGRASCIFVLDSGEENALA